MTKAEKVIYINSQADLCLVYSKRSNDKKVDSLQRMLSAIKAQIILSDIMIVMSNPIPNFVPGGITKATHSIIGETGSELIISNGKIISPFLKK